jgi:hypothetical protein
MKTCGEFSATDFEGEISMRPLFTSHLIDARAVRYEDAEKPGAGPCIVALLALSPLCAVTGLMLAQILGFVPY